MTVVVRDSTARTLKPVIYTVLNTLTVFQFDGRYTVSQAEISFTDFFKLLYFGFRDILAVRKPFQDILYFRRNRLSRQFVYHCYHPPKRKKAENALRSPLSANI